MDDTIDIDNVGEESIPEEREAGENAADAPIPYPVENARHNYVVENGNPQGLKCRTAGMVDEPVQRTSLKEKLAAYRAQMVGTSKADNEKAKRKEEAL